MIRPVRVLRVGVLLVGLVLCLTGQARAWCWITDAGSSACSGGFQQACCSGNLRSWPGAAVTYQISNDTPGGYLTGMRRGVGLWNNVTMSTFRFSEGARTTATSISLDGVNLLHIDPAFCTNNPTITPCDQVLGVSSTFTSGSGTSFRAAESDVLLNGQEFTWGDGTGGTESTVAVVAHETGHDAGLGHAGSTCRPSGSQGCGAEFSGANMYYAGGTAGQAVLELDDVASIVHGYPKSTLRVRVVDNQVLPVSGATVSLVGTCAPVLGSSIAAGGTVLGDISACLVGKKTMSATYVSSTPFSATDASGYTNYVKPTNATFRVTASKNGQTATQAVTPAVGANTVTLTLNVQGGGGTSVPGPGGLGLALLGAALAALGAWKAGRRGP